MRRIKVLIVDDSTVIRRMLSDTLAQDSQIEVVGTAANGKIALSKLTQVNPDVVTLDIEMPEMDGIATLEALRKTHPRLPVIMFSTLTQRGAESTLDALAKGANDYVTKPANVGSVHAAIESVRSMLVPKIKGLCQWYRDLLKNENDKERSPIRRPLLMTRPVVKSNERIDIVAIGVSTGGPNALAKILGRMPRAFPVPIVVVQHMPPIFTKHLADRLNGNGELRVCEARSGDLLEPGCVYIAPGDFHMTVKRNGPQVHVETNQSHPENSCRPAVDVLFRSVAQVYGRNALGLILTGMGQDGLRGCEAIADAGGRIWAQDEATSVVWGMPGAVIQNGLAENVLSLDAVASELMLAGTKEQSKRQLAKVVQSI